MALKNLSSHHNTKKDKERAPSSIRTYDKDGFRRRAACVCVKDDSENEVLLVSRRRQENLWIFPGGGIEPSEDPRQAASREVKEEAGVVGPITRCLGVFETEQTRTCVYVLRVMEEFPVWDDLIKCGRKRMWFTIADAAQALGVSHAQMSYLHCLKETSTVRLTTPPHNVTCPIDNSSLSGPIGSSSSLSSSSPPSSDHLASSTVSLKQQNSDLAKCQQQQKQNGAHGYGSTDDKVLLFSTAYGFSDTAFTMTSSTVVMSGSTVDNKAPQTNGAKNSELIKSNASSSYLDDSNDCNRQMQSLQFVDESENDAISSLLEANCNVEGSSVEAQQIAQNNCKAKTTMDR